MRNLEQTGYGSWGLSKDKQSGSFDPWELWLLFYILSSCTECPCVVVVQSLSHVQLYVTPWTVARQALLSFTIPQSFLRFISIELMMPSNHLILSFPCLLLPSIFPSTRVFFPMSRLFTSGGHSIGASASVSVLPKNIQNWFPLGLTGLISLQSNGLSRIFFSTTIPCISTY